jgi:hypothetical protein
LSNAALYADTNSGLTLTGMFITISYESLSAAQQHVAACSFVVVLHDHSVIKAIPVK